MYPEISKKIKSTIYQIDIMILQAYHSHIYPEFEKACSLYEKQWFDDL